MKKFIKNISQKTKNLFSQNKSININCDYTVKSVHNKKGQIINADIYVGLGLKEREKYLYEIFNDKFSRFQNNNLQ